MPEWSSTKPGPVVFQWCEGDRVLGSFRINQASGFYEDLEGHALSRRFDEAQRLIEKRAAGVVEESKGQGRLAL